MQIDVLHEYEGMSPFEIKDKLISVAKKATKEHAALLLNAGRGNPNWVATTPRSAFFLLGQFAIEESKRVMDLPGLGGMPEARGSAKRLESFLARNATAPGAGFVRGIVPFAVTKFGFDADAFVGELTDSIIGDNYPVPDRMLKHAEIVTHAYLDWAMCGGRPPQGKFDLFAVEGGTAAMCYVFKSLMENKILHKGDTIALGTPIFTPYLEIPELGDYDFKIVHIESGQENQFQFTDGELKKLEDPKVKAFFLVNPANPSSFAVDTKVIDKLVRLVKTKRPDLIVLTDDVYGTFVKGFRSLMADLPQNTIGVYSYSKYFGCTGWRLGVIAVHQDNIFDRKIAALPAADRKSLDRRYGKMTLEPGKLKFIDRIVADSRDVALNHTAGLSLPQQMQMLLFSIFQLMDADNSYQEACMKIVRDRLEALLRGLDLGDVKLGSLYAAYYAILDFEFVMRRRLGDEVADWIKKTVHPLDIVFKLAEDHSIVLLNGGGFDAPNWSARVSLANLSDEVYDDIGRAVRAVGRGYLEAYRAATGKTPTPTKKGKK